MPNLPAIVDEIAAESRFTGVVRVDRGATVEVERAYGAANRAYDIANRNDTQFGIASGTKGLTALTIMSLVADGHLALDTTARSWLGADLPRISDGVTVEHLLAHRSGIGDYLDEDADLDVNEWHLPVAVHELADTEDYVRVLDGHDAKFPPGQSFAYCNSGYVVLALLAQRASATPFAELVAQRVCGPAGMRDTAFLRSDELPGQVAVGYIDAEGLRTNALHLPVRGSGDGGIYSTAADFRSFWQAMFAGRIVAPETVAAMIEPRSDVPSNAARYGLGFWLHASLEVVLLEGMDAGVSFRSVHDPAADLTCTVISNSTDGAWPLCRRLNRELFG